MLLRTLLGLVAAASLSIGAAQAQTKIVDPSKVAPEHRAAAEKRAADQIKLEACGKQADEQKVLVRDRTKFLAACFDKR